MTTDISDHTTHLAICIDASARHITQRRMTWAEAQQFIGGWIEIVYLHERHFRVQLLCVDEEGLLKPDVTRGFAIAGCAQTLAGNGVIFGRSAVDDAELGDCGLPLEMVRAMVVWAELR